MKRIIAIAAIIVAALGGWTAFHFAGAKPPQAKVAEVWKSKTCGCCTSWISYLEDNDYEVTVHDVEDVDPLKDEWKVPEQARSCHTAKIGGYVVEGHVPVEAIDKLLAERPKGIIGIAAPGMPSGAPGMDVDKTPYPVVTFGNGKITLLGKY
ncbi:MAG: DUF411 domain-containing protein [Rhodospirillaceae bacterium]|nr:DUF411 domain-containing protein [Rhodospirillales bacterium]